VKSISATSGAKFAHGGAGIRDKPEPVDETASQLESGRSARNRNVDQDRDQVSRAISTLNPQRKAFGFRRIECK
jgi:hypothetical protein